MKHESGRRDYDIGKGGTGMYKGGYGLDRSPVIGLAVGLDRRLVLERRGC